MGAPQGSMIVICGGRGGNSGDGYVLARHLVEHGYKPQIAFFGDRQRLDRNDTTGVNFTIIENLGVSITDVGSGDELKGLLDSCNDAVLIVDALLGYGLKSELRE